MGYESKVTVLYEGYTNENGETYCETLMTLNLSKMGGFSGLFKKTIADYNLYSYLEDGNTKFDKTFKDPYGDMPKVAGLKETLKWLEKDIAKQVAEGEQVYRREKLLYDSLKSIDSDAWVSYGGRKIFVVHTGY